MIRFLFKQEQPKRFGFKPRYYDADKESLDGRVAAIRNEIADGKPHAFDGQFTREWRKNQRRTASRKSSRNVAFIAAILFLIAYFLLIV